MKITTEYDIGQEVKTIVDGAGAKGVVKAISVRFNPDDFEPNIVYELDTTWAHDLGNKTHEFSKTQIYKEQELKELNKA